MVLASALEPLRVAHDLPTGPDFRWETVTINDGPVQSSSGLQVPPSLMLAEVRNVDYLILVSGYGVRQHATPEVFLKLHPLRNITRHIVGLFAGQPGARAWRRYISEHAYRKGAGTEVILAALDAMPDAA